jgi:hypothetical protein
LECALEGLFEESFSAEIGTIEEDLCDGLWMAGCDAVILPYPGLLTRKTRGLGLGGIPFVLIPFSAAGKWYIAI